MIKTNYSAVIESDNVNDIILKIKALEEQRYPPEGYFTVISANPSKEDMTNFIKCVTPIKKQWKFKLNSPENNEKLSNNELIDEFFITNTINTPFVLYIDDDISPNLSEEIVKVTNEFKGWLYKFKKNLFFSTALCKNYVFGKLEESLIQAGHIDKIYEEHSST